MIQNELRSRLVGHLKELRLPTVRACYEEVAQQAQQESLGYEHYLLEVMSRSVRYGNSGVSRDCSRNRICRWRKASQSGVGPAAPQGGEPGAHLAYRLIPLSTGKCAGLRQSWQR